MGKFADILWIYPFFMPKIKNERKVKAMTTETEKLVYTIDEVSKKLLISRNLCYRLCRERKIPGVIFLGSKRMVVSAAAIRRLLEGNTKPES